MSRLSQFFPFLVVLLFARQWSDPQAATAQSPDNNSEINALRRQIHQMSEMMNQMQMQLKGSLSGINAQLTELKTIAPRLADLEARLQQSVNDTAADVAAVSGEVAQLSNQQDDRFADYCRSRPMGMESGQIPSSSLSSSTSYDSRFVPGNGRIGYSYGWLARGLNMAVEWMRVDLGQESLVYGVVTQGRSDYNQWARTFKLEFGMDGETWTTYADSDGTDKVFQGNWHRIIPVYNYLDPPAFARYVRFRPQTYQSRPVMRVEILGCPADLQ